MRKLAAFVLPTKWTKIPHEIPLLFLTFRSKLQDITFMRLVMAKKNLGWTFYDGTQWQRICANSHSRWPFAVETIYLISFLKYLLLIFWPFTSGEVIFREFLFLSLKPKFELLIKKARKFFLYKVSTFFDSKLKRHSTRHFIEFEYNLGCTSTKPFSVRFLWNYFRRHFRKHLGSKLVLLVSIWTNHRNCIFC